MKIETKYNIGDCVTVYGSEVIIDSIQVIQTLAELTIRYFGTAGAPTYHRQGFLEPEASNLKKETM
jgi:UDP-glucose 4-epimerase